VESIPYYYYFHKERFLPALEVAVVPVIKDPAVVKEADSNSQLLLMVVEAVANMFIQQVAFTSSSFHCSLCPPLLATQVYIYLSATLITLYSVLNIGHSIVQHLARKVLCYPHCYKHWHGGFGHFIYQQHGQPYCK